MAKSKMGPGGQIKLPFGMVSAAPPSAALGVPSGLAAQTHVDVIQGPTGEVIPTPQTIQQCRKPSIVSKLAAGHMLS